MLHRAPRRRAPPPPPRTTGRGHGTGRCGPRGQGFGGRVASPAEERDGGAQL
jgi:hypothetical protein